MIAGALAFVNACQDVAVSPVAVVDVEVRPDPATLVLAEKQQLSVVMTDGAGRELTDRQVAWSSENTDIAQVDPSGMVSATGVGTTRVIATAEGQTGRGTITVTPKPVASVTIEPDELALRTGEEDTVRAVLRAADETELTDREVDWRSSNGNIIQVTGQGQNNRTARIVARDCPDLRARCTAQIVASAENIEDTITITVRKVPAGITITSERSLRRPLRPRSTVQLLARVEASDGTDLTEDVNITWSSSNEDVATVDQTGKVTAVGCPRVAFSCAVTISAAVDDAPEVNDEIEVEVFKIGAAASVPRAGMTPGASASVSA